MLKSASLKLPQLVISHPLEQNLNDGKRYQTKIIWLARGGGAFKQSKLSMINPFLNLPRANIAESCLRRGIRSLSLFGSATQADFRADSDIDVLIEFKENAEASLFDLAEIDRELSELFDSRSVDVVTPAVFRNPNRRRAILKNLKCV